jgi:succinate dehydrogenase / fumarate reductase cytochrome b subunit
MTRIGRYYQSSLGKKAVLAVTGGIMAAFLLLHMVGNLKIFAGQTSIDEYATQLRMLGAHFVGKDGVLWITRVILIVAVLLHIITVILLVRQNRLARPTRYTHRPATQSSLASRLMVVSGTMIFFFIVIHILQFTLGVIDPTPILIGADGVPEVYANLYAAFSVWWIALFYVVMMGLICLHLNHGIWSGFQTLGMNSPDRNTLFRLIATVIAGAIFIGFSAVPVMIFLGAMPAPTGETP